ncbi:MAG: prepilin-type N-terminal cleavage/methylation domain-containing protein [Nitrospirae bacterium]|nr:prepilin-type N-terminal cleavage/methylation domain-containing protein [Nitrospirota bacterium]
MAQTALIDRPSCSVNKGKGFTLIEVLFALSIILITMLGLYKVTDLSMMTNMKNVIRDEGVQVAREVSNRIRAIPFDKLTTGTWQQSDFAAIGYQNAQVTRNFRGFSVTYNLAATVTDYSNEVRQIDVTVSWTYRGTSYNHTISSMVRR